MIAIVKATVCRGTGKVIKEEVIKQVEMTREEYYRPLTELLGERFLAEFSKGGKP